MPPLIVSSDPPDDPTTAARADHLAQELNLPRIAIMDQAPSDTVLVLAVTPDWLELRVVGGEDPTIHGGRPVAIDWTAIDTRSGPGRSLRQPLARAVGIRKGQPERPMVIDTTAGFGQDSWLLASLGCQVTMIEQNAVVAAMLDDALDRAAKVEPESAARMRLVRGDSVTMLRELAAKIAPQRTVVYLDPMFPAARKAAQSKAMKVLRLLAGEDQHSAILLAAARSVARRVVVKRPLHAPPVGDVQPVAVHKGKGVRFDVYNSTAS